MRSQTLGLGLSTLLVISLAVGCSGKPAAGIASPVAKAPSQPTATIITVTPAAAAVSTPITLLEVTKPVIDSPSKPSPTPDCSDNLTFISDLTVPDGTYIARGVDVDKRWQVKNDGTCNWDKRYTLVLVAGSELGLPKEQSLFPARAGTQAVIRLLLTAPVTPGLYTSAWQAYDPTGAPFGDVIYVKFQVN
jgi:Ig-like domain from next to BRCA1 gene